MFMLVFGIAFVKPPVPMLSNLGIHLGAGVFLDHFSHLFGDAAKLQNVKRLKREFCFVVCWADSFYLFANSSKMVFVLQPRLHV